MILSLLFDSQSFFIARLIVMHIHRPIARLIPRTIIQILSKRLISRLVDRPARRLVTLPIKNFITWIFGLSRWRPLQARIGSTFPRTRLFWYRTRIYVVWRDDCVQGWLLATLRLNFIAIDLGIYSCCGWIWELTSTLARANLTRLRFRTRILIGRRSTCIWAHCLTESWLPTACARVSFLSIVAWLGLSLLRAWLLALLWPLCVRVDVKEGSSDLELIANFHMALRH
jgi:hypothetical protein